MTHSHNTSGMLILISVIFTLFLISCDAESITQPPDKPDEQESENTYGGSSDDLGKTIISTEDGGFLIVGTTTSSDGLFSGIDRGNRDVFALKLNSDGNQQWVNTYGGSNSDWAMDVIEDSQGNFVITGYNRSDDEQFQGMNRGENDIFLIKISPSGEFILSRTIGGSDEDYGYAITEDPNGGYLIAGSTRSVNDNFSSRSNSSKDAFVVKTDFSGQPQWIENFGGAENDEAYDLTIGPNNQIAVVGTFASGNSDFSGRNPGESGVFLWKLEPNGSFNSLYTFSGSGSDVANSIVTTSDNGFAIAGHTDSDDNIFQDAGNGQSDAFIFKTNSFGNVEWINTYGGSNVDELYSITESDDGSLISVGHSASSDGDFDELDLGSRDIIMVSTALNGSGNFLTTFGGEQDDIAESVIALPNGNLAFTGWTASSDGDFQGPQRSARDIYKLVTSPSGEVQLP